jgi:NAD(P)-dependent dehydrogenase (short-subunit alcohol dehydrogenase family)
MKKLTNKTAVITGGNSGIGLATAKEFIAQGAKVIITGRNQKSIDEAIALLGENASGVIADSGSMATR